MYGHHAGDLVLQKLAQTIKSRLREDDIAVRWRGEEFFIFLAKISMNDGYLVAQKIRKSIEDLIINYDDKLIPVTFSIGIEEVNDTIPLEDAITNTDNAMYLAKQAGRNTVSSYRTKNPV